MLGRYPLSEGPRLEMKLRKLHGLSYREASAELSLGPKVKLEGDTDLLLGIGSSEMELAKSRKNVLVARTFSKIFGLAGLRIGYGLGATQIIDRLRPFMLGQLSLSMAGVLAAEASMDDQQHMAKTKALHQTTLELWDRCFRTAGWKMTTSEACLCWVDVGQDATPLVHFLAERDVLISGGRRWQLPNCVRISMGTEEENNRLAAGVVAFGKT